MYIITWNLLRGYFYIYFSNVIIVNINKSFYSALVEATDKKVRKLYWVNANAYQQNPLYYIKNNFQIVFHIDRDNFPLIENVQYNDTDR